MAIEAEILLWGRFATSALASRHGEVIAVFEKSLYVETRSGIACIGADRHRGAAGRFDGRHHCGGLLG